MRTIAVWIFAVLLVVGTGVSTEGLLGRSGPQATLLGVASGQRGLARMHVWPPVTPSARTRPPMPGEFNFPLTAVVAPGTTRQVDFTVPDDESFSMTGFVESAVGSASQSGQARLLLGLPGAVNFETLMAVSLEQLEHAGIAHARFPMPIVVDPRGSFALRVRCEPGTAECNVGLLAFGTMSRGVLPPSSPTPRAQRRGMP